MTSEQRARPGSIMWHDLTVPDAEKVRDFYAAVVGWRPQPVDMDGHEDYNMIVDGDDAPTTGICHARGFIADLPPQWLIYTAVADLDDSMLRCNDLGGEVIWGPVDDGSGGRYCVIQDPAGAVMALYQTGE